MPVESASWYVYLSVKITTHWTVSIKTHVCLHADMASLENPMQI